VQVLGFVLDAAGDANADVRSKAVRLTANRLFPQTTITAAIERHARQQLDSMIVRHPRPGSAGSAGTASTPPAAAAAPAGGQRRGGTPNSTYTGTPPERKGDTRARLVTEASEVGGAGEGAGAAAAAQEQERSGTEEAPSAVTPAESIGEGPFARAALDEATAAQLCALYCALCTKKHSLLRHLFEVYGQTSGVGLLDIAVWGSI
jgi:hypothetical protein